MTNADYSYEYFEGNWSGLPEFDALTSISSGTISDFDISIRQRDSQLFINGVLVVDNDGLHGSPERSGSIALTAGSHDIVVTFCEQGGVEVLEVNWSNSLSGRQPIPADGVTGVTPDLSLVGQWGPVISWPHVNHSKLQSDYKASYS